MNYRNFNKALSLGVLGVLMSTVLAAHAQPRPAAPKTAARGVQLPVALGQVNVDPQLRAALKNKRAFDPSRLASKLSVQNDLPVLELPNKRTYVLEPINKEPPVSSALQIKELPKQFAQFKAHIDAPLVAGKRIPKIPVAVFDNRNSQTAIRDQGSRGTCTAFASMAGLEAWLKREKNVTIDLSENHAFSLFMNAADRACTVAGGYTTWMTGPVLSSNGVCTESSMPYNGSMCPASVPAGCSSSAGYRLGGSVHFFSPKYGGSGSLRADNTNLLEATLKLGYDIVYGVDVAGTDWSDDSLDNGVVDVQLTSSGDPVGGYAGHAMLLVGYNRVGRYFIFKNSWGTDSGHNGYVHVSYDYLETYGKYGYAVTSVIRPTP